MADDIVENERTGVIAHHELVLLCWQPCDRCGTFVLLGTGRIFEAISDHSVAIALRSCLGTVPEQYLVVSIERDQKLLELVVLHVPDCLLTLRVDPSCNTVVFALLRTAIRLNISDLGNVPDADRALNASCEE